MSSLLWRVANLLSFGLLERMARKERDMKLARAQHHDHRPTGNWQADIYRGTWGHGHHRE